MVKFLLCPLLAFTCLPGLKAQLNPFSYQQAGAALRQTFDGLPVTGTFSLTGKGPHPLSGISPSVIGLQGWYMMQMTGNQPNSNFVAGTGSSTGSAVYSFGATNHPNRSLGSLASGTGVYAFGLVLKNETGIMLNRIHMRFLATQWRKGGSGNKNTWQFSYSTDDSLNISAGTFLQEQMFNLTSIHTSTGTASLNGHLPANQLWIEDSITSIRWLPGQMLILRWSDTDETGSDDAMALDEFGFTAYQQAGLPTISHIRTDSIGSRNVTISAVINDQLATTSVRLRIDTTAHMFTTSDAVTFSRSLIEKGSGDVPVSATVTHLLPAKKYYYQWVASNELGSSYSALQSFTTTTALPVVTTDSLVRHDHYHYTVFGSLLSDGGGTITEQGICWGTDSLPSLTGNSILTPGDHSVFSGSINQLPSGSKIYFRAYSRNAAGIAYGNTIALVTPTSVLSFKRNGKYITNQDTVVYEIQFREKVNGIRSSDFRIVSDRHNNAAITEVRPHHFSWLVSLFTGSTDAEVAPVFMPSDSCEPPTINVPFTGLPTLIDKTGPVVQSVSIANRPYKSGDTLHLVINTYPEKDMLKLIKGNIAGYPLVQITRQNDSSWKAFSVIKTGGQQISASENIQVTILLADEAGNQNKDSSYSIQQSHDAIDLTRPAIERIFVPVKQLLKKGDSLFLSVLFTEPVVLDSSNGSPVLSVTVGTRIKNPFLISITNNQLYTFCYVIQPDESDMDGIRIANSITLNNGMITDIAGNLLNNTIPNAGIFSDIKVDAVAPFITSVTTPIARTYGIGDSLFFHVFVSEPVIVPDTEHLPYLEITVGNTVFKTTYIKDSHYPLRFYWIVQKGMSDKNGISIAPLLNRAQGITDSSGNRIEPVLKGIGITSNVFTDGIAPFFKDSIAVLEVCTNNSIRLQDILKTENTEQGETLSWTILEAPLNGSIRGLPFSNRWVAGNHLPESILYTPALTDAGTDECVIQVSDGVNTAHQKIKISINIPISNNIIGTDQMVCMGFSAQPLKGELIKGGNGIYHFQWQSGTDEHNYQKATGINNREIYHPLHMQYRSVFRRIVSSGGCTDTSLHVSIEVRTAGLWLGLQSGNWNTGGNWCGGSVPDRQTDVYINETNDRKIVEIHDSAYCKSLSVHDSQLLRIYASLLFTGSLAGNGNIYASTGTIISGGKEKQWLASHVFTHKSVGNFIAAGSVIELTDTLTVKDGFFIQKGTFNTADLLILNEKAGNLPNAPGSVLKGQLLIPSNITGKQKTLLMHHPFRNDLSVYTNKDSITPQKKDIILYNSGYSTADSFYTIHNSIAVNRQFPSFNWKSLSANNNLIWMKNKGMLLWNHQTAPVNTGAVSLLFKGEIQTGDIEMDFTTGSDSNYLLTGNPYLYDINSKYIARSEGIGNYYWVWDTSLAEHGGYRAKAFSANNTIEKMGGLIIKTIKDRPLILSFPEQSKQLVPVPDSLEGHIENTYQLELELIKDNMIHDRLIILDVDSARIRYDAADAEKIMNPESNLYSLSADTVPLAIDARWMTNRTIIPLGIDVKTVGEYRLRFSRVWLKPGTVLELHDTYTGTKLKIDTIKSYTFNTTKDTASIGRNRLIIRSPLPPEPPEQVLQLQVYPVPAAQILMIVCRAREKAPTSILIKNILGQVLWSRSIGPQQEFTHQIPVGNFLKGQYIVEVHSGRYMIAGTFIKL